MLFIVLYHFYDKWLVHEVGLRTYTSRNITHKIDLTNLRKANIKVD